MKKLLLKTTGYLYIEAGFTEWLDILGYSQHAIYNLPTHVHEFLWWLEQRSIKELSGVNQMVVDEYYEWLKTRKNHRLGGGLSNSSINKHRQALLLFFSYLRQAKHADLQVINLRSELPEDSKIQVLTREEIKELYQQTYGHDEGRRAAILSSRDRAMLAIFYGCGLRRNEGVHLDLTDVDYHRRLLRVRKGKNYKERFVPVHPSNLKHIENYVYDWRIKQNTATGETALLISMKGKRVNGQSLLLRLKTLQQRSNGLLRSKRIGLHTLRHSIATHLLAQGMELEKIARFLGHSSLESTQIYTHLTEDNDL